MARNGVFTPPMVEKLRLMVDCGHSGVSIARALGVTPLSVRVKACSLGIRLRKPKVQREARTPVTDAAWAALTKAGAERGMSVAQLCRVTLEAIARDNLWAAVIDVAPPRTTTHHRSHHNAPPRATM